LTCSTCETASRGGTGVEIDLALVPKREPGMTAYETLLSESQERMLIIVKQGHEVAVTRIFEKWDLPYACIGRVTDDGQMRVREHSEIIVEIPAAKLADDAPVYERAECVLPAEPELDLASVPATDPVEALWQLLADPTIASKNWLYRQYDHTVRAGTVVPPGSDAGVFYVREAGKFLAATSDCNGLYCRLDPREGAKIAVAEACRNLVCSGATPLALTDNLNFGNPYRPENFWQLREAVDGLAEACREFGVPVTGGNVSLYNENPGGAIDPTPTVGMIGIIDDPAWIMRQRFCQAGDAILGLGDLGSELGGSQYLKVVHGRKAGRPPRLDYGRERTLHGVVRDAIRAGLLQSVHDCSEGGLGVAVAESGFGDEVRLGATLRLDGTGLRADQLLFNESQSRVVVSTRPEYAPEVLRLAGQAGLPARRLGEVGGPALVVHADGNVYGWDMERAFDLWYGAIARAMATR
jgi:phosphoribosylformylglycinamidine synthase II